MRTVTGQPDVAQPKIPVARILLLGGFLMACYGVDAYRWGPLSYDTLTTVGGIALAMAIGASARRGWTGEW